MIKANKSKLVLVFFCTLHQRTTVVAPEAFPYKLPRTSSHSPPTLQAEWRNCRPLWKAIGVRIHHHRHRGQAMNRCLPSKTGSQQGHLLDFHRFWEQVRMSGSSLEASSVVSEKKSIPRAPPSKTLFLVPKNQVFGGTILPSPAFKQGLL